MESKEVSISDYQFLVLLLATMRVKEHGPIIDNHELEKDLYYYYDNPNYNFLFEDIIKKEEKDDNNYVDLDVAFQTAYALGTLGLLRDNANGTKSANLISKSDAEKILLLSGQKYVSAMSSLYSQMTTEKGKNKIAVLMNKPTRIAN